MAGDRALVLIQFEKLMDGQGLVGRTMLLINKGTATVHAPVFFSEIDVPNPGDRVTSADGPDVCTIDGVPYFVYYGEFE